MFVKKNVLMIIGSVKMAKKEKDNGTRNLILGIVIGVVVIGVIFMFYNSSVNNSTSNFESPNPSSQDSQNNLNENSYVQKCEDDCSFYGDTCFNDDVYSCYDNDGDGCKEKVFEFSCDYDENCVSGKCVKREYCGDGICQSDESCSSCSSDCGKCKVHDLRLTKDACAEPERLFPLFLDCSMECAGEIVNYGDYIEDNYKIEITVLNPSGDSYCDRATIDEPESIGIGGTHYYEYKFDRVSCSCLDEGTIVQKLI